jgi:hypothetical protein
MSKPDRVCFDYIPLFDAATNVPKDTRISAPQLADINAAKAICNQFCPESTRLACLKEFGDDANGVVGGMYATERRAIGIPVAAPVFSRTERADDRRGGDVSYPSDWSKNDGAA